MTEIKLPAMSPTMEEGTLAKWLVKEGDTVKPGDVLAEIETDKATMELEADEGGVVEKLHVADGSDGVKVGTLIATIRGEDEAVSNPPPSSGEGDHAPSHGGGAVEPESNLAQPDATSAQPDTKPAQPDRPSTTPEAARSPSPEGGGGSSVAAPHFRGGAGGGLFLSSRRSRPKGNAR